MSAEAPLATKAEGLLLKAEKVDPSYPPPHLYRGLVLLEDERQPAAAIKELKWYLARSPDPAMAKAAQTALAKPKPSSDCRAAQRKTRSTSMTLQLTSGVRASASGSPTSSALNPCRRLTQRQITGAGEQVPVLSRGSLCLIYPLISCLIYASSIGGGWERHSHEEAVLAPGRSCCMSQWPSFSACVQLPQRRASDQRRRDGTARVPVVPFPEPAGRAVLRPLWRPLDNRLRLGLGLARGTPPAGHGQVPVLQQQLSGRGSALPGSGDQPQPRRWRDLRAPHHALERRERAHGPRTRWRAA